MSVLQSIPEVSYGREARALLVDPKQLVLSLSILRCFRRKTSCILPQLTLLAQTKISPTLHDESVSQDAGSIQDSQPMPLREDGQIHTRWEARLLSEGEQPLIKRRRIAASVITSWLEEKQKEK
jgi:hypothetical protein